MLNDEFMLSGPEDRRRALLLLLLLGLVLFGAGIGLRDPWPADEPRFALVARQMVESGQWLFPFRGGELYPDKPPVFMWIIAVFLKLTGSLRVAFLMPSLLAGLGSVALVHDLTRRLWDRATAWRAGLLLLLTVQFTLQARTAQIDGLVTFFILLGVYGFLRFLCADGGWRWYFLGWFAAGLGVITKGVGILALFALLPALWTHRAELRKASRMAWLKGLAGPLFLLGAIALWAVPMMLAVKASGNPDYLAYQNNILFRQTVTRYGSAWHHVAPWWDYLVSVIPAFWLPLSLFLPWLAARWYRAARQADRRVVLLVGYLVLVLVFFSASPGKRGVYITPATPALALLAAPHLPELLALRWPRRLWMGLVGLLALLSVLATVALLAVPKVQAQLAAQDLGHPWLPLSILAVMSVAACFLLRRSVLLGLVGTLAAVWLVLGFGLNPAINDGRIPKVLVQRTEATVPAGADILLVDYREQFFLYVTRPWLHLPYLMHTKDQARFAAQWQAASGGRWVLGPKDLLEKEFDLKLGTDLGKRHSEDWWLMPPGSARPSGPAADDPLYRYVPAGANP